MLRITGIILLLLVLLAFFLRPEVGPRIEKMVNGSCGECELSVESATLSLLPAKIEAKGVKFRQGKKIYTEISLQAKRILVPFSLVAALRGRFYLGEVDLLQAKVEITEGDGDSPDTPDKEPPLFHVEGVAFAEASFRYRRQYRGRDATISLDAINAQISGFGTHGKWMGRTTTAELEARLEQSGKVKLNVSAVVFSETPDVGVKLEIRGQKLPEVNRYFFPSDGIRISGFLREGVAEVNVKGDTLESQVKVIYDSLDVMFSANRDRSGVTAFFSNLLRGIKLDDKNSQEPGKDQKRAVQLKRREGESMVSFILRGMMDAALGVATS